MNQGIRPLLAHVYSPVRVTYPCYVQPKLNGIRALYQAGHFQSRDLQPFPVGLLKHLAEPLLQLFKPDVILDGELYVHGWPLQRINAAVTPVRQEPSKDTVKVEYHVFDVVDFQQGFMPRFTDYEKWCEREVGARWLTKNTALVKTSVAANEEHTNQFYAYWVAQGYEGMMLRLGDCPYTLPKQRYDRLPLTHRWNVPIPKSGFLSDQDNRVWHLLKRKDWQDDEFICVGVQEGEGKLKGTLGAFLCEHPSVLRPQIFSVGSGLTDAERQHYWSNPPIGRLIKVKYLVLSSDGIPLNPTILAIL